jgi:ribosome modulation factor
MINIQSPYQAGYDAGFNGANTENCNYTWFATPEMTKQWEEGNEQGVENKQKAKITN